MFIPLDSISEPGADSRDRNDLFRLWSLILDVDQGNAVEGFDQATMMGVGKSGSSVYNADERPLCRG